MKTKHKPLKHKVFKNRTEVAEALGNWFVADKKLRRIICFCTRIADAYRISDAINKQKPKRKKPIIYN